MQGSLKAGRLIVGHFGVIHPGMKAALGLKTDVMYAELEVALLTKLSGARAQDLPSDFPSVKRDVTLKIPAREQAGRIVRFIEEMKKPHVRSILVSDDFRKEGEDFRRTTLRLVFQSPERTLEHAEVDQTMNEVLAQLKDKHGLEMAV
jgi:phenylalanyl-tRNA synthetase beta chain